MKRSVRPIRRQTAATLSSLVCLCLAALGQAQPSESPGLGGVGSSIPVDASDLAAQTHAEGVRLLRLQKLDQAVELLESAVAFSPKNVIYVTDLGYAYLKQRRYSQAEVVLKQAIALDPTRYHAYEHLEPSITLQPERWEKRRELLRLLDRGLEVTQAYDSHLRIELARIRAERAFGLIDRARAHLDALIARQPVPRTLEKSVQELKLSLEQDRQARALRDWPEPNVPESVRNRLAACERNVDAAQRTAVLAELAALNSTYPAWRAPRWLRAQRLTTQGHYDEAVKELTILVRLAPSDARYHRSLGQLLAEHGGLLELDRADQELRIAYALEPEWTELVSLREKLAARRTESTSTAKRAPTQRPTENALQLYEEAEALLELTPTEPSAAIKQLELALRESPGFIDAAAALYTLGLQVPEPTVQALWNDPSGLFALYREFMRLTPPVAREVTDAWLQRAIELGNVEARLTLALAHKSQGQVERAELELSNYLALISNPEEIEAVLTLRSELATPASNKSPLKEPRARSVEEGLLLAAKFRVQQDDTASALSLLQAPCSATMTVERLLAIGIIHEHDNNPKAALDCYELGLATFGPNQPDLGRRTARLLARAAASTYAHPAVARLASLVALEPAAAWALAKQALAAGDPRSAEKHVVAYLAAAAPDDRFIPEAHELQGLFANDAATKLESERQRRSIIKLTFALAAIGLLSYSYLSFFRGATVARALRRRSRMFPELSRVVGELRHDVFKHRTSALSLLTDGNVSIENLRSTLLEPVPTSEVVTEAYERLKSLARNHGVRLRRLHREPVFGPLVRDLERAERALSGASDHSVLLKVDARLRSVHLERLGELLEQGPKTRLDAVELQRWIAAVQAEFAAGTWTVPALHMSEPLLAFPIDKPALFQIFSNLLRNAESAVSSLSGAQVQVGVTRVTDFTGQTLVRLQVSDNAAPLGSDTIEHQDPRRGLGIVRETARTWNGLLFVANESAPYTKAVGAQFPQ